MPKRRSGPAILGLLAAALMGLCPPVWMLALAAPAEPAYCPISSGGCDPCPEQKGSGPSSPSSASCRECCSELTERQQLSRPAARKAAFSALSPSEPSPRAPALRLTALTRRADARAESPPLHLLDATFRT